MAPNFWIGLDLGGTKILGGLFDDQFQVVARAKLPTPAEAGAGAVFSQIGRLVAQVMQDAGVRPEQITALGLGVPGQVDPRTRSIRFAPNLGWKNLDLAAHLPPNWSWPCFVENDVKLGTFGEFAHGAAAGARHVVGIFVGTGIGGGLILNGELYSGFNFSAGEIGHTIIHWRKGLDLEAVAGRHSLMKRAAVLLDDAPKVIRKDWKGLDLAKIKSSQLAALYQKGDLIALQLVEDAAHALAAAVGSALNLLSPEVIVIGGGVAGALGPAFVERIWELAQRYALPNVADGVRCVPAALGDDAGIVGAATFARSRVLAGEK